MKSGTSATITLTNPPGPHTGTPDAFNFRQSALFNVEDSYTVAHPSPGTTTSALNDTNVFTHNSIAIPPLPQTAFTNGGYNLKNLGTYTPPMPAPISIP